MVNAQDLLKRLAELPPRKRALLASQMPPLSFAQQRLWFLDQLEPNSTAYNMPAALRLKGDLDAGALERAFGEVVRRHEVLRTVFATLDGGPVQLILPDCPLKLEVTDLSGLDEPGREAEAARLAAEEARRPFDLSRGPLLRASLLRLSEDEHVLLLTMHHIASDAWSLGVLIREAATLYEAFAAGKPSPLAELPVQYADYAVWQREYLSGDRLESQLGYWRRQLADLGPALELPGARPRPDTPTYRGGHVTFRVGREATEGLRGAGRAQGATLFMVLLAGFQALLSRYTGREDVAVGTPVAGRGRAELEGLIGFFVNTLVLRTDLAGDPTFSELVGRAREVCLGAYAHQEVPFERVVEELQPERSLSRTPLFQVMLALQNAPAETLEVKGLQITALPAVHTAARLDLILSITEADGGLTCSLQYNADLFERSAVERLADHYATLLAGAAADPSLPLSRLPLLTDAERRRLLVEFNDTAREYPRGDTIHSLFGEQARRTPDAVALACGGERLSYRELDERSNQLARYLRSFGVGPEVLVGICLSRSAALVEAILGVLKAGGAYVPLDPEYPRERLSFMLEDSRARVLVTESGLASSVPESGARLVALDGERDDIARHSADGFRSGARPDNLAYVIYTSGSTGRPKGVAIAHRSTASFLRWAADSFTPEELSGVLASTSVCFDLSVFELFAPLSSGGAVILAASALSLPELPPAQSAAVTLVNTVPSAMAELVRAGSVPDSVLAVNLAGEPLANSLAQGLYGGSRVGRVLNLYGPTEDTTYSTWAVIGRGAEAEPTIGRPVANTRAYVLDEHLNPAPEGATGELYLGGAGLARGYLNRPSLTAERFVPDPYGPAGSRLYRTGDVCRWGEGGELEYVGRLDGQVKVRGYRIEPGEVEAALRRHAGLREAAVVARGEAADRRRLVAYVVAEPGRSPSAGELREHLRRTLPEHMVPSAFVTLERLPLTPNGKVDRKALPEPEIARQEQSENSVRDFSPTEEIVAGIWSAVLGVDNVGLEESFFELGGHSLLAAQVISRIREAFKVEVSLRALFERPTVAGLSGAVEDALRTGEGEGPLPPVEPVPHEGPLPLSFAQQRLWFIDQLEGGSAFYNSPAAVRLRGPLDAEALGRALSEVARRHGVLRTRFGSEGGEPYQEVEAAAPVGLGVTDLSGMGEAAREAEAARLAAEEARRPFDLSRGPLLRASLLRLSEGEHVLLLTMHHIASDAWSLGVLIREAAALYEAFAAGKPSPLAELPVQYADYAVWQRRHLSGERLEAQLAYWRRQLAGLPPTLELPGARRRPATQGNRGGHASFRVGAEVSERLRALGREQGATLFMVLLAGFKALLSRYTGREDVAVGTAVAGRGRAELEGLIGFFVNALVLRVDLGGDPTFLELLGRVREVCLGAYAHQEVPFERVVEELAPERTLARSPLFQIAFGVQNAPAQALELKELRLSPLAYENEAGRYDLTLWMNESEGGLVGRVTYDKDLYDEQLVQALGRHYTRLLESIAADPEAKVCKLQMLTDEELEARRQAESASATSAYQKFISTKPAKVVSLTPPAPSTEESHT